MKPESKKLIDLISKKTVDCIESLPDNTYAVMFYICVNEDNNNIPTLSIMYNTTDTLENEEVSDSEDCWNVAFWYTDEYPVIGNNIEDTDEAEESTRLLMSWFDENGIHNPGQIVDDKWEITAGYVALSKLLYGILQDLYKTITKDRPDIVLLWGDLSYYENDIEFIKRINGNKATAFIDFFREWNS